MQKWPQANNVQVNICVRCMIFIMHFYLFIRDFICLPEASSVLVIALYFVFSRNHGQRDSEDINAVNIRANSSKSTRGRRF